MQSIILILQSIAGFGLIGFGCWVTVKGIHIITRYYPLTLRPGEPLLEAFSERGQPTSLAAAMLSLVNAEIASISSRKRPAATFEPDTDDTPSDAVPPADDGSLATEQDAPISAQASDARSILDGAAGIIEALPKLLNANFGPAAIVCLIGLLIIAGGFYMLLQLSIAA